MIILCGTDFSTPARAAADAAAALAVRANQPLLLVHVVDEPGGEGLSGKQLASRRSRERELLGREAARLRKRGAKVQDTLLAGTPDEALVKFARKSGAQLVVVSSLGRRTPARWLLGSVAERTAQSSPVPTLVIRSASPFVLGAFEQRKLKVLMGVDFSVTSDAALAWLKDFHRLTACELVAVHLNWPPEEHERLGVHGPVSFTENLPEVRQVLERDVKERVSRWTGLEDFRVRVEVAWGRSDTRLIDIAREEQADLVVVGTHQRHGLDRVWQGSVSRGLLHNAPMSVACVAVTDGPHASLGVVPRIQRVLVTTDFSALGNLAIAHACSLVGPGGVVRLVHVVHPRDLPGGEYHQRPGVSARHERFVRQCHRRLLALVPPEAAALGLEIEVEVVESGETAKAICQTARRTGADVICISSHGHGALRKAVMGSVALAVMTQSRRPLLVVREPKT